MSDIKMKKVTDLPEKIAISDNDLIVVGNAGTASLRKTKWSTFWNAILTKIRSTIIVNNKVTTEAGYALDARMGEDFQKQIDDLNTNTIRLWAGTLYPNNAVGTYNYVNIPADASKCAVFILYLTIAEDKICEIVIPNFTGTITKNVYLGMNYSVKVSVNLNITAQKLGIKIDRITGWTYNMVHIDCLYGIRGAVIADSF